MGLALVGDVRLVVIDPMSAYLGETDSHRDSDVRGLIAPLSELAAHYRLAVVGIHHLNKGGSTNALYRVTGSLAFVAAARVAHVVVKDKENRDRRMMLPAKNNLAPDADGIAFQLDSLGDVPVIRWESTPVKLTANEALAQEDDQRAEREEAKEWLRIELANGPLNVKDLQRRAKDAGHAWPTVKRAKKDIGVKSIKSDFAGGWLWSLPKHLPREEGQDVDLLQRHEGEGDHGQTTPNSVIPFGGPDPLGNERETKRIKHTQGHHGSIPEGEIPLVRCADCRNYIVGGCRLGMKMGDPNVPRACSHLSARPTQVEARSSIN